MCFEKDLKRLIVIRNNITTDMLKVLFGSQFERY